MSETVIQNESTTTECVITEGQAKIKVEDSKNIFYNPVQEFNRDMSVAVLSLFAEEQCLKRRQKHTFTGELKEYTETTLPTKGVKCEGGLTVLEALSATGLRSIRFAKEVPGISSITANDISKKASEAIKANVSANNVEDLVSVTNADASLLMYQKKWEGIYFDAIDLDPYGCPSRFLDSAVQSVRDGGILLVTCTDMAVLCGNTPETCYTKYGAISLRAPSCHELALRIALQCIESHATRYGRYITPLLSFSVDFYIRVVVQIRSSPLTCKRSLSKLSHVYRCVGCKSNFLQPLGEVKSTSKASVHVTLPHAPQLVKCPHCNYDFQIGGPVWNGPLCSDDFITSLLSKLSNDWANNFKTSRRMIGLLTLLRDEVKDAPLFHTVEALCSAVHCCVIPLMNFRSALINAGFAVSLSHAAPNSIKTNAPTTVIWDVIREWVKENPVSKKRLIEGSVALNILSKTQTSLIDFTYTSKASLEPNVLRYQVNPLPNWGPGMKAQMRVLSEDAVTTENM